MDKQIPYVAYESALARADRINGRLWVLCIILSVMLIFTNLGWVIYESQFVDEYVSIEAEQEADGNGNNYIIGGDYGYETENKGVN